MYVSQHSMYAPVQRFVTNTSPRAVVVVKVHRGQLRKVLNFEGTFENNKYMYKAVSCTTYITISSDIVQWCFFIIIILLLLN